MKLKFACLAICAALSNVAAAEIKPFTGVDLSGIYNCDGNDAHDGAFKAKVTLSMDKNHSTEKFGSYNYRMDVEGFGVYRGVLVANGNAVAITFANDDTSKKDYGTGAATLEKTKDGKPKFSKFYFQPEYEGSNHGVETCVKE